MMQLRFTAVLHNAWSASSPFQRRASPPPSLPAAVAVILVELAVPASILVAAARPWLTMLQGAWWIQTAYIM